MSGYTYCGRVQEGIEGTGDLLDRESAQFSSSQFHLLMQALRTSHRTLGSRLRKRSSISSPAGALSSSAAASASTSTSLALPRFHAHHLCTVTVTRNLLLRSSGTRSSVEFQRRTPIQNFVRPVPALPAVLREPTRDHLFSTASMSVLSACERVGMDDGNNCYQAQPQPPFLDPKVRNTAVLFCTLR